MYYFAFFAHKDLLSAEHNPEWFSVPLNQQYSNNTVVSDTFWTVTSEGICDAAAQSKLINQS